MLNAANRIFGSIDGYFDRSAGPGSTISEDLYSQQAVNISYPCGSFAVESVAAFAWNGWQASSGISGNLGLEYAF